MKFANLIKTLAAIAALAAAASNAPAQVWINTNVAGTMGPIPGVGTNALAPNAAVLYFPSTLKLLTNLYLHDDWTLPLHQRIFAAVADTNAQTLTYDLGSATNTGVIGLWDATESNYYRLYLAGETAYGKWGTNFAAALWIQDGTNKPNWLGRIDGSISSNLTIGGESRTNWPQTNALASTNFVTNSLNEYIKAENEPYWTFTPTGVAELVSSEDPNTGISFINRDIQGSTWTFTDGLNIEGRLVLSDTNSVEYFNVSTSGTIQASGSAPYTYVSIIDGQTYTSSVPHRMSLNKTTNAAAADGTLDLGTVITGATVAVGSPLAVETNGGTLAFTIPEGGGSVVTNIGFGLTGNGDDTALAISSVVVTNNRGTVSFGTNNVTDMNVGDDLVVQDDVLIYGDLAVIGYSSNVTWSYSTVNYRTNVYYGTNYYTNDVVIYTSNNVYLFTNIVQTTYTTQYVDSVSVVGGNIDYALADSVLMPYSSWTNGGDLVATGTWDFTGATLVGATAVESDPEWSAWRTNAAAGTTNAILPNGSLVDISSLLGGGGGAETDPVFTNWFASDFTNAVSGLIEEIAVTGAVTSINSLDGAVTIAGTGSIGVSTDGQTITVSDSSALATYYIHDSTTNTVLLTNQWLQAMTLTNATTVSIQSKATNQLGYIRFDLIAGTNSITWSITPANTNVPTANTNAGVVSTYFLESGFNETTNWTRTRVK